jgi:hypothetical protein
MSATGSVIVILWCLSRLVSFTRYTDDDLWW